MNLSDFIGLSKDRLIELAKADELPARFVWLALKGASRYVSAAARGDVACDNDAAARSMHCATCPTADRQSTGRGDVCAIYCGRGEVPGVSCGCLVAVTVGITTRAAGKTIIESERCPQGHW